MSHNINYNGDTGSVDFETSKKIADAVDSWDDGSQQKFSGFAFDRVNQAMRVSLRVDGVPPTDISTVLSDLDTFIDELNTEYNVSFSKASNTAAIQPDSE